MRDTLLGRITLEDGEVHLEELGAAAAEPAHRGAGGAPRLRHELARRPRGQVPARAGGARSRRGRLRQRVPLSNPDRRAGNGGGGDQPERRDRGHPGRLPRGASPGAPCPSRSATSRARCSPARRRARSSPTPGPRSGSPPPRPSPPSWWPSPCSPCTSAGSGARSSREDAQRHLAAAHPHPPPDGAGAGGREGRSRSLTRSLTQARDFLYLGRGINYPIALEGALKLKEISYVHAEGYPGRGDEARAHRPHRRVDAGGGPLPDGARLRQDALERAGGEGAGRPGDRGGLRGRPRACGRSSTRPWTPCSRCRPRTSSGRPS